MTVPFSKFHPREAQSASETVLTLCEPHRAENPFLHDYLTHLGTKNAALASAIAKEGSEALTAQGKAEDELFEEQFVSLRSLTAMKAAMSALGAEAEASAVLSQSIIDHGDRIHDFSRTVQITTIDTLLGSWQDASFQVHIDTAKMRPMYNAVVTTHEALKATEALRSSEHASSDEIPGMWEAKRELTPALSKIYSHISDYAELTKDEYRTLLSEINATLAPLVTQVRARETRKSSE